MHDFTVTVAARYPAVLGNISDNAALNVQVRAVGLDVEDIAWSDVNIARNQTITSPYYRTLRLHNSSSRQEIILTAGSLVFENNLFEVVDILNGASVTVPMGGYVDIRVRPTVAAVETVRTNDPDVLTIAYPRSDITPHTGNISLTVRPPGFVISPSALHFSLYVNENPANRRQVIRLINDSERPLDLADITFAADGAFVFDGWIGGARELPPAGQGEYWAYAYIRLALAPSHAQIAAPHLAQTMRISYNDIDGRYQFLALNL
jgi:hypothetical protein